MRRPLRVAIFSTGNELVRPGTRLGPGAIYDSNRIMLAALLTRLGAKVLDLGILRDDPEVLAERLPRAAEMSDLVLTSGGVSLGEEDHVKAVVEAIGQLVFWRLAIKPGRPLAMGTIGATPFVGLPGNPVAVYVTFAMFVRPILAHLAGAMPQPLRSFPVRSAFSCKKRPGRREYVRVHLTQAENGHYEAQRFPKEGAALLTSLTQSEGLVELADGTSAVSVGDLLPFYPHEAFW